MHTNNHFKVVYIGGFRGENNLGDSAMALNMIERLSEKVTNMKILILLNNFNNQLKIRNASYLYSFFQHNAKFMDTIDSIWLGKTFKNFCQLIKCIYILLNGLFYKYFNFFLPIKSTIRDNLIALSECDLLWFGGGGVINDIATISGVYNTALLCLLAEIFRKKIIMTGQGFGPLRNFFNIKILSFVLPKIEFIAVRDYSYSKNLLLNLGVPESNIILTGDDAASLKTISDEEIKKILISEKISNVKPMIGVNFRPSNFIREYKDKERAAFAQKEEIDKFAKLLDYISEVFSANIIFIPTVYRDLLDDRESVFKVYLKMKYKENASFLTNEYNPFEIKSIIGKMDYFLGFSYHSLLFALTQNVPAIGFYNNDYYSLKHKGLFEWFGLPEHAKYFRNSDLDGLKAAIKNMILNHDLIQEKLKYGAIEMKSRLESLIVRMQDTIPNKEFK
jgi:polysaccharide pyruvyl transferase WcaK-like protein